MRSPAFLLHHHCHRLSFVGVRFIFFCSERSSVCRLGCRAVSHPIGRIFCPAP